MVPIKGSVVIFWGGVVVVIYWHIKNCPTTELLKTNVWYQTFCASGIQERLSWVVLVQSLMHSQSKCWLGLQVSADCGAARGWLLAGGPGASPLGPLHVGLLGCPSWRDSWLPAEEWSQEIEQGESHRCFYDLVSKSHTILSAFVLFVRTKLLSPHHIHAEEN